MSLASCFAGIAFSNASTTLAHAGGRALGAKFHVPHGLSIALLLPFVMEFGLEFAQDRYAKVAVALGADPHKGKQALALEAVAIVNSYNDQFGIWTQAKAKFFPELAALQATIPEMTKNALAGNGILTNRVVPTEQDVTTMFEKLMQKLSAIWSYPQWACIAFRFPWRHVHPSKKKRPRFTLSLFFFTIRRTHLLRVLTRRCRFPEKRHRQWKLRKLWC